MIGVVVRNETGEVLAALSEKTLLPHSVVALEAIATRRPIQFISELGISQPVFEGDSKVFFNSLLTENSSISFFGHIVKEITSMASSLKAHSSSHTRRQSNSVAHALVKRTKGAFALPRRMFAFQIFFFFFPIVTF